MYKLRMFIAKLMYGRNGVDSLFYGLFAVYAAVCLINTFARSVTLYLIGLVIIGYSIFRVFSKNITARRKENARFCDLWGRVKNRKYNKNYVFRKCPCCHTRLRLPRKRGRHTVCCPKCKVEFKVRIWL